MARQRRTAPAMDPLLLEVAAAIGAGRITIGLIESADDEHVYGVTLGDGSIIVNPAIETVDTIVHECLHRLRPHWSERTVRARTARIMKHLHPKHVECLYTLVMTSSRIKRRRRPLKIGDGS